MVDQSTASVTSYSNEQVTTRPDERASLAELVKLAQARDRFAFERLFYHYRIPLSKRLLYLIGNDQVVEDLCQETFIRVWVHLPRMDSSVPFESWFYRIATNLAIDYLRHARKLEFITLPESDSDYLGEDRYSTAGPEKPTLEREILRQALASLSPQYRICLLLQDLWGYSQHEISNFLGISDKTVSSNISRGRKQLSKSYILLGRDE